MRENDHIEYAAILSQMDKGLDVDAIDAINAMRWRCDNQRREIAKLHERQSKVLEALRTLFAACDSPIIHHAKMGPQWLAPAMEIARAALGSSKGKEVKS